MQMLHVTITEYVSCFLAVENKYVSDSAATLIYM